MPSLRIDHVTIAASRLEAVAGAFAACGLEAEYGGQHSNGATHMSKLGFDDGSYIELVSVIRPGLESPWWHQHIVRDLGPCAWAVRIDDIELEAERLRAAGITVQGPHSMARSRPDGASVRWDLAYVGDGEAGALHPFVIADRSDRGLRATPSAATAGTELSGVMSVVVGVADASVALDAYARAYGFAPTVHEACAALDAHLTRFDDHTIVVAEPATADGWLAARTQTLGASPCAFLLASTDLDASRDRFALSEPTPWADQRVCWFDSDAMWPLRLGIVGP